MIIDISDVEEITIMTNVVLDLTPSKIVDNSSSSLFILSPPGSPNIINAAYFLSSVHEASPIISSIYIYSLTLALLKSVASSSLG